MGDDVFEVTLADGSIAWFSTTTSTGTARDQQAAAAYWHRAKLIDVSGWGEWLEFLALVQKKLAAGNPELASYSGSVWLQPNGSFDFLLRGKPGQRAWVTEVLPPVILTASEVKDVLDRFGGGRVA